MNTSIQSALAIPHIPTNHEAISIDRLVAEVSQILIEDESHPGNHSRKKALADITKPQLKAPEPMDAQALTEQFQIQRFLNMDHQLMHSSLNVKRNLAEKDALHKERLEKLEASKRAMEKSKKAGLAGKIFGWIATVAGAILGGLLMMTGIGAVAGGMLMASSGLSLVNQISTETGNWFSGGISHMFKGMGLRDEQAKLAANITIAAIIAALGITGGIMGASKSVGGVAQASAKSADVANKGLKTLKASAPIMDTALMQATTMSQFVAGTASVGQGAALIPVGVMGYQASRKEADSVEVRGDIHRVQQRIDNDHDFMKNMMSLMMEAMRMTTEITKDKYDTNSTVVKKFNV